MDIPIPTHYLLPTTNVQIVWSFDRKSLIIQSTSSSAEHCKMPRYTFTWNWLPSQSMSDFFGNYFQWQTFCVFRKSCV